MTESEWLTGTKLQPMAELLNFTALARRKQWLLVCACCRRIWPQMADERSRRMIEVRELHAIGAMNEDELREAGSHASDARQDAKAVFRVNPGLDQYSPDAATGWAAAAAATIAGAAIRFTRNAVSCLEPERRQARMTEEEAAQCNLLRDIFGNPFRPVVFDPKWRTPTAELLSRGVYLDRAFDRMPILADALEEAGCDDRNVLDHCRSGGAHVRGCWVVDLVMGFE